MYFKSRLRIILDARSSASHTAMHRRLRHLATVCLAVIFFVAESNASGEGPAVRAPTGTTVNSHIDSRETGVSYRLLIYLPPGHDEVQRTFPVIYAMDGDSRFERLVEVLRQHRVQAILVGVSCVSIERRVIDYTMPGASAYYRFLTRELVPFIEHR